MKMKIPTTTSLVLETLRERDDFMTVTMLSQVTGRSRHNINSALWMLKDYRAVGVEISNGEGWWYARPVEDDARSKHYDERTPESKPRKLKPRKTRE